MAYKFNAITGKLDLVNSATDIDSDLAVSGELYEVHGNLGKGQPLPYEINKQPVKDVLEKVLFADMAPLITVTGANDWEYAYCGETITKALTANLTKRTYNLVSLTSDNWERTDYEVSPTQKTQSIVLQSADFPVQADRTVNFTVTDAHSMTAVATKHFVFRFPMIYGTLDSISQGNEITINRTNSGYTIKKDNVECPHLSLGKFVGQNASSWKLQNCHFNAVDEARTPIVLVHGNRAIEFERIITGGKTTQIDIPAFCTVDVTFTINGNEMWTEQYTAYRLDQQNGEFDAHITTIWEGE